MNEYFQQQNLEIKISTKIESQGYNSLALSSFESAEVNHSPILFTGIIALFLAIYQFEKNKFKSNLKATNQLSPEYLPSKMPIELKVLIPPGASIAKQIEMVNAYYNLDIDKLDKSRAERMVKFINDYNE
jgi:hypothetical protein